MIFRTVVTCVALISVLAAYSIYDHIRWQEFEEQHECTVMFKTAGYHIMQPTYNIVTKVWSTSPVYYPGHTQYKCNDGNEYAR